MDPQKSIAPPSHELPSLLVRNCDISGIIPVLAVTTPVGSPIACDSRGTVQSSHSSLRLAAVRSAIATLFNRLGHRPHAREFIAGESAWLKFRTRRPIIQRAHPLAPRPHAESDFRQSHEREGPPTGCDFGGTTDCSKELLHVASVGKTMIRKPSATHAYENQEKLYQRSLGGLTAVVRRSPTVPAVRCRLVSTRRDDAT
jgi:hypothetical protein